MSRSIWLIIEPDVDLMTLHIFMKCGEDSMTFVQVIEQKREKKRNFSMIQGP